MIDSESFIQREIPFSSFKRFPFLNKVSHRTTSGRFPCVLFGAMVENDKAGNTPSEDDRIRAFLAHH